MQEIDKIRLEILRGSHIEHFKTAKDMALFMDIDNPRKKRVEEEANNIINKIHKLKS